MNSTTRSVVVRVTRCWTPRRTSWGVRVRVWGHDFFKQRSSTTAQQSRTTVGRAFSTSNSNTNDGDGAQQHVMFEKQMMELQEEREALFGFTDDDRAAWSQAGNTHRHADDLMEQMRSAQSDSAPNNYAEEDAGGDDEKYESYPNNAKQSPVDTVVLSHLSKDGRSVHMVDVGDKQVTRRTAHARSIVELPAEVVDALGSANGDELMSKKGPVFETAKIAGILAAKKTSDLIPLCHPLPLEQVQIDLKLDPHTHDVIIDCVCRVTHKTGVELEALTGATVAALTVYDMVKAVSHHVRIRDTRLVSKTGGRRNVIADDKQEK